MIPLHFGESSAPLFGVYHPASRAGGSQKAVVVCNAFGAEYMVSHYALRRVAQSLAAAGVDVLRFDYFGTGDSFGEPEEMSLARWQSDIVMAMDELRDLSGAEQASLFGVRLGAALACRAASVEPDRVTRIVAWDPVLSGDGYLAWLDWAEAALHPRGSVEPQALGHVLPDIVRRELRTLDERASMERLGARFVRTKGSAVDAPRPDADGPFERSLATGNLIVDPVVLHDVLDALGVSNL